MIARDPSLEEAIRSAIAEGRAGGVGRRPGDRRVPGAAPRSRWLHGGARRRPRRRPRSDRRPPARPAAAGRAGARHAVHPRRRRPRPGRHGDADARSGCSRSSRSAADRPATRRSWPGALGCPPSSPARRPASLREGELVEVDGGHGPGPRRDRAGRGRGDEPRRSGSDARRGPPAAGRAGRPTATRSRCSSTSATPPERPRSPRSTPRASACSAPSSSTSTGRTRRPSTSRSRCTPRVLRGDGRPQDRRPDARRRRRQAAAVPQPGRRAEPGARRPRPPDRAPLAGACSPISSPRWPSPSRRPAPSSG